jgi:hypothetical protein
VYSNRCLRKSPLLLSGGRCLQMFARTSRGLKPEGPWLLGEKGSVNIMLLSTWYRFLSVNIILKVFPNVCLLVDDALFLKQ